MSWRLDDEGDAQERPAAATREPRPGAERWLVRGLTASTQPPREQFAAPRPEPHAGAAHESAGESPAGRSLLKRITGISAWVGVLVLLALAVAAVAVLRGRSGASRGPARVKPAAQEHGQRTPFVADGVRFAVFERPHGQPVRVARGKRLIPVLILTRNLGRTDFNPLALRYRIADARGGSYTPVDGAGGRSLPPVPRNAFARTQLMFRVPVRAGALRMTFETRDRGGAAIVVPFS